MGAALHYSDRLLFNFIVYGIRATIMQLTLVRYLAISQHASYYSRE